MKKSTILLIISTAVIFLAGLGYITQREMPSVQPTTSERFAAPDFTAPILNGSGDLKLSAFKGKIVVLNFWATWCPPCVKEIPDLIKLQETYKDDLAVIGASLDRTPDPVGPFIKKKAIRYPVIMADEALNEAYGGIQAIPTTFILDRNLNIVNVIRGLDDFKGFEKAIRPYL